MYRKKPELNKIYACDFETTVYEGQTYTEVWSSAICPVRTPVEITGKRPKKQACENDVIVHHSITETYQWLLDNQDNCILYYHNLKFDGSFWLDFLLKHGWTYRKRIDRDEKLPSQSIETCISDMGQWYYITLWFDGFKVEMRDSLKLLPMSLRALGKSFKTKHQKLEMEYSGKRYAGCPISNAELMYIKNDVLVLMECLEIMFSEGHTHLTIGSCCMSEFRQSIPVMAYKDYFTDLTKIELNAAIYGAENVDAYIRKSYKGGWCYAMPSRCSIVYDYGCTADVNSLYPSMMSSESGNVYPVGIPHFFKNKIPEEIKGNDKFYYFVRIQCRFKLKAGYLPFIQIKGNPYYKATEMLTDSRPTVRGVKFNKIHDKRLNQDVSDMVTMTLTCTDYKLFHEHYQAYDETVLDGCYFYTTTGLFDSYINKYKKIKMSSTGAKRTIAKLFLNNLYGKMSSSTESSYKYPVLDKDGIIKMVYQEEHNKKAGYIAIGAAITSYARNFTIRAAQANYKYFVYADTDSIHCICGPDQLKNVPVHPTDFCHWKIESTWDKAYFVRQKTYIEHVIAEDEKPADDAYYNVKCAGLPNECKNMFITSMTETEEQRRHAEQMQRVYEIVAGNPYNHLRPEDDERYSFLSTKRGITDFNKGLSIPLKLMPVRISGGIILKSTTFEIR